MRRPFVTTLLGAALVAAPQPRPPQQGFLDQGVLLIARDGVEIGREEFAIRTTAGRRGEGGVLAVATVRYRDREMRAALELTGDHTPVSYQLDVTSGGRLVQRLTGQFGRGRFSERVVTPTGEVAREFPVPPGAMVLDDDIFHLFYFAPRPHGSAQRIAIVRPGQTAVVAGEVRDLGEDTVAVGGHGVVAARFALALPGGDSREYWFSAAGDLLKAAIPSSGITATRLSLPAR